MLHDDQIKNLSTEQQDAYNNFLKTMIPDTDKLIIANMEQLFNRIKDFMYDLSDAANQNANKILIALVEQNEVLQQILERVSPRPILEEDRQVLEAMATEEPVAPKKLGMKDMFKPSVLKADPELEECLQTIDIINNLTELPRAVYQAIIDNPNCTIQALANITKVKYNITGNAVRTLEAKGLVAVDRSEKSFTYRAKV